MKNITTLSAAIGLTLLLAGCGGDSSADRAAGIDGDPVTGGTAIIAVLSDFDALNPFVSTDYVTGETMRRMLFTPLVELNEEMGYDPYLAESVEVAEDGMSVTFVIRDDVTWHDGEPLTADDVVWSIETYMDPALAYPNLQYFRYVDRVEETTPGTIVVYFNELHSDPLADFLDWQPLPRHLLGDIPVGQLQTASFNRDPVGSGPFRFVSWSPNQQVVFEANEEFALGRPNLDRIVFRTVPEQTTQLTELLTGRVDFVRAIQPAEAGRLGEGSTARLIDYPARSYTYVAWDNTNPLFSDARVRRALSMAIDRQEIVDALLYGYGTIARTDVMPFQWQYNEELDPLPYDPIWAKEILAEAGWADRDGDGILDRDGQPFRFVLETNQGNDLREDILVIVQSNLADIGIDAQPRLAEWNSLIDRLVAKDFVSVVAGWNVDFKFDPSETLTCDAGSYNFPSYCNPAADALVEKALVTLDREKALPLWYEYQEIIHRDQPYTFLYYLDERLGVAERLQGVEADARGFLISVRDWWIPESLQ